MKYLDQYPGSTHASLTSAIPKAAQAGDFGPNYIRSISPFLFARYVPPNQQHIAAVPPLPQNILGSRNGTVRRLQLGLVIHPVHYRVAALLISSNNFLSRVGISITQGLTLLLRRLPHHFQEADHHVLLAGRA